ncbi:glycosyltransferase family 4 protein [Methylovirgula sp. 4M-Z18]|uniref:glycosyltransferase family 4 protein n=1 Tax=Methylovirgula sp. 4M-Z18 TaxID=2293567 RepID=UPI0011C03C02|nr:glycosyltransferase family 4 protein [Methylovirgula sp. 4M-Z18]
MFRTRCGLQRGAELMVRDMREKGIFVYVVDLSNALQIPINLPPGNLLEPTDLDAAGVSDLIIHLNPPLFTRALTLFDESVLSKVTVIGNWVWELQKISDDWREGAGHCDEIWAPSPFVFDTLVAELPGFRGAIKCFPYPVDRDPMARYETSKKNAIRATYGIAPDDYVAGFGFSFASNYARKNPTAAIDAFRAAFPADDTHVRLLLRCFDGEEHPRLLAHLKSFIGDDKRVTLIDGSTQSWPLRDFYASIDTYLSLHRSEGYGLQLAEAAQAGASVIATGWGLAPDIACRPEVRTVDYRLVVPLDPQDNYTRYEGALWAEPDIPQAATLLTQIRARRGAG